MPASCLPLYTVRRCPRARSGRAEAHPRANAADGARRPRRRRARAGACGRRADARCSCSPGPGNNGGDAFEVATHLKRGFYRVDVVFAGDAAKLPHDAGAALAKWNAVGRTAAAVDPARARATTWSSTASSASGSCGRSPGAWPSSIDAANALPGRQARARHSERHQRRHRRGDGRGVPRDAHDHVHRPQARALHARRAGLLRRDPRSRRSRSTPQSLAPSAGHLVTGALRRRAAARAAAQLPQGPRRQPRASSAVRRGHGRRSDPRGTRGDQARCRQGVPRAGDRPSAATSTTCSRS